MDPVGSIASLLSLVNYLRSASDKVKGNQEQCHRLADHLEDILRLIEDEVRIGLSPDAMKRLSRLKSVLLDLNATLDELADKPMLKKILWRDDIGERISLAYKDLSEAVMMFDLGSKIDVHRFQVESDAARRADSAIMMKHFEMAQKNDHEILTHLEIHRAQMQEAMMALHKHLLNLGDSDERRFLENGMHAMQRRSGGMKFTPDMFVITSLDVVIHYDRKIGEGGFGEVFEADWQGNRVAVKVLEKGVPTSLFQKEIDVWKQLRHPNILEFFGACSIADPPFSVCALKSNGDAMNYLRMNPSADRPRIVYQASLGLGYLHSNSIIHADIKAANVLIDEKGNACLCDFGMSKIRTHATTAHDPSSIASALGTPRWMSPEQMSLGITNKQSDIYSLGMTIYEVFSGVPPFASTPDSFLLAVVVDRGLRPPRPIEPHIINYGLTDRLWALIEECWSQDPANRPLMAGVISLLASLQASPPEIGHSKRTTTSEELQIASWRPLPTILPEAHHSPVLLTGNQETPYVSEDHAPAGSFDQTVVQNLADGHIANLPSSGLGSINQDYDHSIKSEQLIAPRLTSLMGYDDRNEILSTETSNSSKLRSWYGALRRKTPEPTSSPGALVTSFTTAEDSRSDPYAKILKRAESLAFFAAVRNISSDHEALLQRTDCLHRKIVVLGDGCSGKTCLIWRWLGKRYEIYAGGNTESHFMDITMPSVSMILQIQDTPGQEEYDSHLPLLWRDADLAVFTYSIGEFDNFTNIFDKWEPHVKRLLPSTPRVLLGCKMDCRSEQVAVTFQQGQDAAVELGAVAFMECSARTDEGVGESLRLLSLLAFERQPVKGRLWRNIFR